jgi:hypothetical protein
MKSIQQKTNTDAPDADHEYGKIRDEVSGVTPGTPVNTESYGDVHQLLDRLMDLGEQIPNDLPENTTNGYQLLDALLTLITKRINTAFTLQTGSSYEIWTDVVWGNGYFVAVNNGGTKAMRSIDGKTWTEVSITPAAGSVGITIGFAFGAGLFVASIPTITPGTDDLITSPDGVTWTIASTGLSGSPNNLKFLNGGFIATSNLAAGFSVKSADGITWSEFALPDSRGYSLTYGNGVYVGVTGTGISQQAITSPDGENWTLQTTPGSQAWGDVSFGNDTFVAVSFGSGTTNNVMTSPDGVTWTLRDSNLTDAMGVVLYSAGLFYALRVGAGSTPPVMSSPTGMNWTEVDTPDALNWNDLTSGGNKLLAVRYGTSPADAVMIAL